MRWSDDQATTIYSIWLYDQNNGTQLCDPLRGKWLAYMREHATHPKTGLWTPDSGPIVAGIGVAASGLAPNAGSSVGDEGAYRALNRSISPVLWLLGHVDRISGLSRLSRVGTHLLATAIYLNAQTQTGWNAVEKRKLTVYRCIL